MMYLEFGFGHKVQTMIDMFNEYLLRASSYLLETRKHLRTEA